MEVKTYKTHLALDFANGLNELLERIIKEEPAETDEDKLWVAALAEIHLLLQKRLVVTKPQYQISLTAVQAMALRIMVTTYCSGHQHAWLSAKLLTVANSIHRFYTV
jgi:hypothetical protein